MRINPIQIIPYNQPVFKAFSVKGKTPDYDYYTTTRFFREDIDWDNLIKIIHDKYKDVSKVNVICHACSDGEEPYSLAMLADNLYDKDAQKYFPIIAKDVDDSNIFLANKGFYYVEDRELSKIKKFGGYGISNKYCDITDNVYSQSVKIKKYLKDKVIFEQGNILEDIDNIPRSNTILFCRNFWPYLPPYSREELADKIAKSLDSSSLVVIGDFDIYTNYIDKMLMIRGFEPLKYKYILQKKF